MKEDLFILIEENTTYDLNWIYCRRKIIAFTQFLRNIWIKTISHFKFKTDTDYEFITYRGE